MDHGFFCCRESLWDRPPVGYEHLTPAQYKAMRGALQCILNAEIHVLFIGLDYLALTSIMRP